MQPDLGEFQPRADKTLRSSVEVGADGGEFQTGELNRPIELRSDWDDVLRGFGLDPAEFYVVDDTVRMSKWQQSKRTEDGNRDIVWLYSYKARFARRAKGGDPADVAALLAQVLKRKPSKKANTTTSTATYLCLLADFQLGKGEGGGTPATTERILTALDKSVTRYRELKKLGRVGDTVALVGLGDLVESCRSDWYASQTFLADLSDREQDRLARRLILRAIDLFVDEGCAVIATGVPGNHGENRQNGKMFTNFLDNRDYAAFETVAEICAANPERYEGVTFALDALNNDDLTATLTLDGVVCSFAHGHQFRSGTNAQAKMEAWWKGQAMGRTGVSEADILFAGHLHHFVASEGTGRQVFQVPAMDGGSQWYQATSGANAQAGMMTLVIGRSASPRGWDDLKIL